MIARARAVFTSSLPCAALLTALTAVASPASIAVAQTERELAEAREQTFVLDVDDAIARANGYRRPHRDRVLRPRPAEWAGAMTIAVVFHRFFSGIVPNDTGIERPTAEDHMVDEFEVPFGGRLSYVLMGAANDHLLTPLHFYQQFDGVHMIRYDLATHEGGSPFRLALSVSPAYGSITIITRHNGVTDVEQLPTSVIIGGAGAIDGWYELPLVQVHARVLAMPGVDVLHGASGVEIVETIQMIWQVSTAFHWDPVWPIDVSLIAMHLDRGDARVAVYEWSGDFRSPAVLRELWQFMALLELSLN